MLSKRALLLSVMLHVVLVVLVTVSLDFAPDEIVRPASEREVVRATVIDDGARRQEAERRAA
ncbi:MAG: hypothetical protein RLW62_17645, partial [Gammaproteobacteria bacterium]